MNTSDDGSWPVAVLFDLDGTLIDSVPDIHASLNAALADIGLGPLACDVVASFVGDGAKTLVARALRYLSAIDRDQSDNAQDPPHTDHVYKRFIEVYDTAPCRLTRPYPGAVDALTHLNNQGVPCAVVTNKPQAVTESVLAGLDLAKHVAAVVGAQDGRPLKPAPDMILAALQMLDCSETDAVFVGDSIADVSAARAAGIPVIAVRHGYTNIPVDQLGADEIIDHFEQLPAALTAMSGSKRC
ncbi:MAG: phosphoglycolate phosphatase [Pseudomonadota bacterium]